MEEPAEKENPSQKILATAFECLASKGYANVSMRDIAGEAGVALSQLNYYYKNKQGLFTQVIDRMIRQSLHEIEGILNSAGSPKEKLDSRFPKAGRRAFRQHHRDDREEYPGRAGRQRGPSGPVGKVPRKIDPRRALRHLRPDDARLPSGGRLSGDQSGGKSIEKGVF